MNVIERGHVRVVGAGQYGLGLLHASSAPAKNAVATLFWPTCVEHIALELWGCK